MYIIKGDIHIQCVIWFIDNNEDDHHFDEGNKEEEKKNLWVEMNCRHLLLLSTEIIQMMLAMMIMMTMIVIVTFMVMTILMIIWVNSNSRDGISYFSFEMIIKIMPVTLMTIIAMMMVMA